jgi:periplasmic protein CpxP/Spy
MQKSIRLTAILFAALLLTYCSSIRAQDSSNQQPNSQGQSQMGGGKGMRHGGPERRLEFLSQQLNLTDDQKSKLKPILEDESKQMKTVWDDASLSEDQKHAKMKDIRESTRPQIEAILTPDQKQKFEQLKNEGMEHHKGKMANPPVGTEKPNR